MMDNKFEGIEFNTVDRVKVVRKKKHYLLRFLIFLFICGAIIGFISSGFFGVQKIKVEGNHYYSDDQVINMSKVKPGDNIFWGDSIKEIPDNLLEDPYFTEVDVKKGLPKTIIIDVKERTQLAAIVCGEKYMVIDGEGILLRKSKVNPKITVIYGLTLSKLDEGKKIDAEEKTLLDLTLKMINTMHDGDIFFKKIDMSKVVIKAYVYDTLVVKGTPKQIISSIEKGDLQKVVNHLIKHDTTRGTITMGDHNYMAFSPNF